MKKILLLLFTTLLSAYAFAQDFPSGQFTLEDMGMKSYSKDTSAHALVLDEFGDARINTNIDGNFRLYFNYHVKIKIFDAKGFSKANVEIPIYNGEGEIYEDVQDLKGTTYYTADNGSVVQDALDSKKIFTVKRDKHWSYIKFAMPNIHNGCIIEYSYNLISPYYFNNFHTWEFQDDIPKVKSEYMIHIPAYFSYKALLRGPLKVTKSFSEVETDCTSINGTRNPCSKIVYGMADIPAFIEEDYMTSPKNFLSAIYFELSDYVDPYGGVKKKITKEWEDVDYQLKINEDFGSQLKKKDLFKEKIKPVIAGATTDLDKAKAVYAYVQKWFKWNDYIGIYSDGGIRKAIDAHTGSVADINMSLVAALGAAGLKAQAVLLSTREHGAINTLYPGIGDFNYLVARVEIGDKAYLMDASDQLLAFNMVPLKCLNDKGRVFSLDKPSFWIDMATATGQREDDTYNFDLTLQENGKIKGTITHYSLGYQAYAKRKEIKKFNTVDEYVENLDERLPKLKILKSEITNLDSLNLAVAEKYEVEIEAYDNLDHNKLTYSPYFFGRTSVNPFKLAERDYPVDWGMPSVSRYSMSMHLPAGYAVTAPKDVSVSLPNGGGRFITSYSGTDTEFTFSHITTFSKSIYSPAEYPYLKELYNKIIQTEKEDLVFAKK